jgi:filamentous hemagglutinin family protein
MKAASLNHIYRLVWSHVQNAWTVVSETAKTKGKKSAVVNVEASSQKINSSLSYIGLRKLKLTLLTALSALAIAGMDNSFALPTGIDTIYGSNTIVTSGNNMTITQNSDKAIVNVATFNIASGEAVNVLQCSSCLALYQIQDHRQSEIFGSLTATGTLLLINPNGVLFGHGSEVSVGNIIASSLGISNDDFLKGNYHFVAGSVVGNVENYGVIKTQNEGYIVLLGKTVNNSGTLVANNGSVVLASAQEATLDFFGNGLVKASLSGNALEAVVKNSGTIQVDGGFAQMATNARSSAINISGIVEANQLVERDGMIRLEGGDNAKVEVSGQLIARGQDTTGGTIEVTGQQVALMSGAVLDASGDKGGGTVLVGGDYQGKNDAVYNSQTAYISSGATIKADALKEGNGGKVIVWADSLTRYYGSISAQGAATAGNGGFVEVSGKQDLDFNGAINVAAINGVGGTVLLDPENITLTNVGAPVPDKATGTADLAFATTGTSRNVDVNGVSGFSELYLQATNNIDVNSALTMTDLTAGSVRLEAGNDINVNAAITAGTSKGNISLTADNNINVNAALTSGIAGVVALTADANNSGAGNIAIGADITGHTGVTLSAVNITHTAGNINTTNVIGPAGSVTINATGDVNLGTANINATGTAGSPIDGNGGNVEINARSLAMTGSINTSGSASSTSAGGGGQGGSVVIRTTNDTSVGNIVTSSGDSGATSNISRLSGSVHIASTAGNITTGNIQANGGVNGAGASFVNVKGIDSGVTLTATAGSVTAGDINTSAGTSTVGTQGLSAGNVTIKAGTGLNVATITASGGNGNGTNISGGSAGKVDLRATSGDIAMGAVTNTAGTATGTGTAGKAANIIAQAGNDLTLNGNILTSSKTADAVQLVAGRNFKNIANAMITTGTGGRWTVYSSDPTGDIKGANLLAAYDYKQYGTTFGGALLGTGNGFVHAVSPTVTATLTGSANKVFDGNNTVTDLTGLSVTTSGAIDGDKVTVSPITAATYDTAAVGSGKPISSTINVVSITTNEGKQIFNPIAGTVDGYTVATNSNATGNITAVPTTPTTTGFASPRDDAGLGGLIGNNPALNTMTIVSLNPAAGDEEDLDAVACPVNEDSLGSTPILNSGVKLPDGVNSNCI